MKKIMCFGTFDLLHEGHLNYFEQAKKYGDYLIVVVARDINVEKEKGEKASHSEEERRANVEAADFVDKAVIGNEVNRLKIVEEEKPDVIVLGYDQNVDSDEIKAALAERDLHPEIVRAKAFFPEKYKSSIIRKNGENCG